MGFGAILAPIIGGIATGLLSGGGDDDGPQQPPGNKELALLAELFSSTGALDALFQNIAAREDPTIPALLNTQISRLADQQGGGGFDANAFLGGDFSTPAPSNPLTLGGADSPFNVPLQQAGGVDPIIQALIDSILTPATVTQGVKLGTPLTESAGSASGGSTGIGPIGGLTGTANFIDKTSGSGQDQLALIENILGGTAQQGPGPAPEANGPISGSFQLGGMVPFDGNFALHRGEQVIAPGGPAPPPPISPGVSSLVPGGRGEQDGLQQNAFDPLPPPVLGGDGGGTVGAGDVPGGIADAGGTQTLNPLQQAIQALLGLVQGGGPITPQIAQQQQNRIADVFGQQLQSSQRGVQENFGGRGLGGSGIEASLGLQQALGLQQNAAQASNDLAVQQALQNFGGLQGAAQGLGGLSLGAGQFGLQQQQQQNQQNQDLIQFILQTLQGTFAPGSGTQTLSIV